ncbi:transposase [Mycoplasmopsis cynos]|nr:transposase [Mycoplasmopsis cynos]WAM03865.1 transposase [Mycoplasmopsis cynos]
MSIENRIKNNYRNGSYKKSVKSSFGNVELEIPRDRNSEFEPHIIPKYQYDISEIESQIINLYSKGVSTRDISDTLHEIYGVDVDRSFVSRVTDKITPQIVEWQNRPLERTYAMIFIDNNRFKVKEENGFVEKVGLYCYEIYSIDGYKDVLGFWIGESESAKHWMQVFNDIKLRGVQEIYLVKW